MGKKDFRSAEKITTVASNKGKPRFGPWMTSPFEARRNRVKGVQPDFTAVYMCTYK